MFRGLVVAGALFGTVLASHAQTLRFADLHAPDSPTGKGATKFAELVKKYSDGDLTVRVYPSGQLGDAKNLTNSVKTGALDMAIGTFPLLADIVPEYNVYNAGYFFDSWSNLKMIVEGENFGKKWNKQLLDKSGIEMMAASYYGARDLTTKGFPVKKPADLNGKKIRAVPNSMSLAVDTGLGGKPTPVAFPDLFQALSQGVVDAQENPLPTIESEKFYEVQDHLMLTQHQLIVLPWIANAQRLKRLSDKNRKAVLKAAQEAAQWTSQRTAEVEKNLSKKLADQGMTVVDESDGLDLEAFKKSVRAEVKKRFEGKVWPSGLSEKVLEASKQAQ
ncbi:TRAP transporter substrate-binding protein [Pararhizobium mangrovi]|nr:TRAP transporter substrate-binding protein [Pararhizobium mangrovi]